MSSLVTVSSLLDALRLRHRPAPRVEGRRERRGVADPLGHLHRLHRQAGAALAVRSEVEADGEAAHDLGLQRAVLVTEQLERVLEPGHLLLVDDAGQRTLPADGEGRASHLVAMAEGLGRRRRRPERSAAGVRLPTLDLGIAERDEHVDPGVVGGIPQLEGVERHLVEAGALLVGHELHRAVPGAQGVADRLLGRPGAGALGEVEGELGQAALHLGGLALDRLTDLQVQAHAPGGRDVPVEGLPHDRVGEAVVAGDVRLLGEQASGDGLVQQVEQLVALAVADDLQRVQVELASHDRRRA